ncbi:hypothetical protein OAD79_02305 [Flavobacteriales bacterium]|jgi:hypothetical protein|nr:hypothetical protein [Flavobacteriales bacterium]
MFKLSTQKPINYLIKLFNYSILLLLSLIIISCGSDNKSDNKSDNGSEVKITKEELLNIYKNIINEDNLVSKSKGYSNYEYITSEEVGGEVIKLTIRNDGNFPDDISNFEGEIYPIYKVSKKGRLEISSRKASYINFRLNKNDEITMDNIMSHYYDHKYSNAIQMSGYGLSYTVQTSRVKEPYIKINRYNKINDNSSIYSSITMNKYGDTIMYNKVNPKEIFSKSNVVSLNRPSNEIESNYNQTRMSVMDDAMDTLKVEGKFLEFLVYEGKFSDEKPIGIHYERTNGFVESKTTYQEGGVMSQKITYDVFYPNTSNEGGRWYDAIGKHFDMVNMVFNNQKKYNVETDNNGYVSFIPPNILREENYKDGMKEGEYNINVGLGTYTKGVFINMNYIPKFRLNYSGGRLNGKQVVYDGDRISEESVYEMDDLISYVLYYYFPQSADGYKLKEQENYSDGVIKTKSFNRKGELIDESMMKSKVSTSPRLIRIPLLNGNN